MTVVVRNEHPQPECADELLPRRTRRRIRLESPYYWQPVPVSQPDGVA